MPIQFITAPDLAKQSDWLILDASYYLDGGTEKAENFYLKEAIPDAKFWNINECADPFSALPHMKANANIVSHFLNGAGFEKQSICVYDQLGLFSAPRLAWELSLHLDQTIWILTGGLPSWRAHGIQLSEGKDIVEPTSQGKNFALTHVVGTISSIKDIIDETWPLGQIVDARSPGRFAGTEPEPRAGLRSGHIPGSINIPYSSVVKDGQFSDDFDLKGLDLSKPIITTCGSGITAAGLALALELRGAEHVSVYDGSWTEWGDPRSMTPVETGPA